MASSSLIWANGKPTALDKKGSVVVVCEKCGSRDLNFDGWDIDKCNACGHWRYR